MDDPASPAFQGPFELSGGDPCLDFANTWGDRGRPETDGLRSYAHVLAFARQTGFLDEAEAGVLAARAGTDPARAEEALQSARALREALYAIFSARALGGEFPAGDLACLNRALGAALPNLYLGLRDGQVTWQWRRGTAELASPLWPIARAAANLLTAGSAPVRECGGAQCTWLFLDHSRGRSRRWCSMASCGNRAKARRHYHRSRKGD